MISGYVSNGVYFKAIDIFWRMRDSGVQPDIISFASVLSACSQLTALEQGREIHSYISNHKLESSEVIMGALLDMYAKCGAVEEARHVFYRLPVRDVVSCMKGAISKDILLMRHFNLFIHNHNCSNHNCSN
ncbi:hypothetical protein ZOSMA_250G00150 [Zostera marina]|uniref:Pentatricopeptide repeat-containing protein n=1 Tax=Zostera marina TaxID=29655 RepID=A0A0K9PFW9_ZOSMR|nr:hypothetical protein ZOSMA_250G00150 [Zostera marina]